MTITLQVSRKPLKVTVNEHFLQWTNYRGGNVSLNRPDGMYSKYCLNVWLERCINIQLHELGLRRTLPVAELISLPVYARPIEVMVHLNCRTFPSTKMIHLESSYCSGDSVYVAWATARNKTVPCDTPTPYMTPMHNMRPQDTFWGPMHDMTMWDSSLWNPDPDPCSTSISHMSMKPDPTLISFGSVLFSFIINYQHCTTQALLALCYPLPHGAAFTVCQDVRVKHLTKEINITWCHAICGQGEIVLCVASVSHIKATLHTPAINIPLDVMTFPIAVHSRMAL